MATATPNQLIAMANKMVDDTFDNSSWITWMNAGIDDLAEVMMLDTKATLTSPSVDMGFTLPDNFMNELLVQYDPALQFSPIDLKDMSSIGYKIFGDTLYIQGATVDTVDVYYYRYPGKIDSTAMTTPIDIPEKFQEAVILYACMRAMESDDEPQRYAQFRKDYDTIKVRILRQSTQTKTSRIGSWRVIR